MRLPMLLDQPPPAVAAAAGGLLALSAVIAAVVAVRRHPAVPARAAGALLIALALACGAPALAIGAGAWAALAATGAAITTAVIGLILLRPPTAQPPVSTEAETARLLEAALSACGDGVAIMTADDPDHVAVVYSNAAFGRLTGYSADEAMGLSPSVLVDEPNALEVIREAVRGTEPVRIELPGVRKDGTHVWAEWHIVPVTDERGRHTHSVAVLRDVTGRRDAEQALRESEARFRGLFEQAADGILVFDQKTRILDANRQACQSLGYTRDELTTLTIGRLGLKRVDLALGVGETSTAEGACRRKDGGALAVEVRYTVIETDGRRVYLAMIRDLSRRRLAEQTLREREELLRGIISNIPCGVFWKDRELTYLGCNDQVARDHGLAHPDQVVGRTDYDISSNRDEATFYRNCDTKVIETGVPILNLEEHLTKPDGSRTTLLTSKVPLRDARGQVVGVLGVYQDITDRKRLEEQLRQSQKLEAVGRLAGGVAHDFNNLLTIIRGNAELLRAPGGEGEGETLLDDLVLAADRATALIRQLLMFGRRQPGRAEVLDLNEVVTAMAVLLRRGVGDRVAVEANLAADPVPVAADRSHLEQVVMNLAVNARDAMPNGGRLTVRTEPVRRDTPDGPKLFARLTIADTGTGMTDEVKARIFEPFFTTKGSEQGTGLGLATVFGIVQQARGHVEVESAPGAGTTFRVDLPWCEGARTTLERTPAPRPRTSPASGRRLRVLLLDDQDGIRTFVRLALRSRGHEVHEVSNGEAALGLARRTGRFDIVVTDLSMPGMDGCEFAARMREAQPDVGVVLMSGYAPTEQQEGVRKAAFLQKPFTPATLLEAVEKALRLVGRDTDSLNATTPSEASHREVEAVPSR